MFDVFYTGTKPGLFSHEKQCESIEHATQLSRTRFCWIVTYLADYTGWDWLWEPTPWQAHQRHAWPSQWQKDSGTYLIPKQGYSDTNYHTAPTITRLTSQCNWTTDTELEQSFDFSWHPDPTDPPFVYQFGTQHQRTGGPRYSTPGSNQIKFVDQIHANVTKSTAGMYIIDHLDGNAVATSIEISQQLPVTQTVRYFDNYQDTLKRIAKNAAGNYEWIWICSSVCDYTKFDFSWHPEQWQAGMLHVFASDGEKFGDTFFMHVPTFTTRINQYELLEWYDINFVATTVTRRPLPVISHSDDCHVDTIKNSQQAAPLAIYTNCNVEINQTPCVPLWQTKTKTVVPLAAGASAVIVPREAQLHIKNQVYDYPYINKTQKHLIQELPLDIVFLSNGEDNADHNWERLKQVVPQHSQLHRINGIQGRVQSQHAAAAVCQTPFYFFVPAKLFVNDQFDWNWQPDRLQAPKHYIFNAKNPVTGLEYGHQAMVAYNKKLVLATTGTALDFTLEQAHEVVPILSGTAYYAQTPVSAWRTAFREVIKLRAGLPDVESEYRLDRWLNFNNTNQHIVNEEWSRLGAQDAMEYYDAVQGNFDQLCKSYEWSWLASYAMLKRNLL